MCNVFYCGCCWHSQVEATKRLKAARAAGDAALGALLERAATATAGSGDPGPHISVPEVDPGEGSDIWGEDQDEDEVNDKPDEDDGPENVGDHSSDVALGQHFCGGGSPSSFQPAASSAPTVLPQLVSRDDVRQGHSGIEHIQASSKFLCWISYVYLVRVRGG